MWLEELLRRRTGQYASLLAGLSALWLVSAAVLLACRPSEITVGITVGGHESNAARLAFRDARHSLRVAIDTVFIPSASASADHAVEAARTLTSNEHLIAVVGHGNSAATIAAAQMYNARQVVQVAPHATAYVELVDLGDATIRAFAARYRATYGHHPNGAEVLTYDAVRLLLEAINHGARSGPEIQRYFESLGRSRPAYRGIAGPIQFDPAGDMQRAYALRTVNEADQADPTR